MLEVKTYNQEKNTWNVKIHNKNHEIKIDIWNDLYVDGELLGPFREFFQMDLNTNRSKYVFKVDGEKIEYKWYPWEKPSRTKAHLFMDGKDLITGEQEITYVEHRTPILPQIFGFLFLLNAGLPWGKIGAVYKVIGLILIPVISSLSVNDKIRAGLRGLCELGVVALYALIGWILYTNGVIYFVV